MRIKRISRPRLTASPLRSRSGAKGDEGAREGTGHAPRRTNEREQPVDRLRGDLLAAHHMLAEEREAQLPERKHGRAAALNHVAAVQHEEDLERVVSLTQQCAP